MSSVMGTRAIHYFGRLRLPSERFSIFCAEDLVSNFSVLVPNRISLRPKDPQQATSFLGIKPENLFSDTN